MSKKVPLLKAIVWELCWRCFSSVFIFCKTKGYFYWKHNFCRLCVRNPASRLLQIGHKPEKWKWRHNFSTWRHRQFFWRCGIITIFFYKGLTRNSEIGNTLVWALPNIWRLGQGMDTKFGTNVSNKILLNAEKFQGYSCSHFWVMKGKPTGAGGVKLHPHPDYG